jgi:hypothetical protein
MTMIDWLLARLSEPSTFAGFSGLALALGVSTPVYGAACAAAAAVAGLIAAVLHEKKPA